MTETREQYRDRLAQILDAEYAEAFRTPEERSPWDMVRPEWKQKMGDMAEAVYAQALRDVMDWLDEQSGQPIPTVFIATGMDFLETIEPWLTERGIDLTESEDES